MTYSRKISKQMYFLIINQWIFKSSQKNKHSILSKENITEMKYTKILLKFRCNTKQVTSLLSFLYFQIKFEEKTVFLSQCIQDLFGSVYGYLVGFKMIWGKKKTFPDKPPDEKVAVPDSSNLKLK